MIFIEQRAETVAAASAALLYNVLPSILRNEASEVYQRLLCHIRTAILAFCDDHEFRLPEPSEN
jgi:hypothetical protein